MTIAVTTDEVKEIIQTDKTDLTTFIDMADLIITENLSGKGMSDNRLKKIKILLSSHYLAISQGEISKETLGDASADYSDRVSGRGFASTSYGRQAIALDSSAALETMSEEKEEFYLEVF